MLQMEITTNATSAVSLETERFFGGVTFNMRASG